MTQNELIFEWCGGAQMGISIFSNEKNRVFFSYLEFDCFLLAYIRLDRWKLAPIRRSRQPLSLLAKRVSLEAFSDLKHSRNACINVCLYKPEFILRFLLLNSLCLPLLPPTVDP